MEKNRHESRDDYLEAILQLEGREQLGVKAVDVSRLVNVSMPAITKAMSSLKKQGYIKKEVYGNIYLTKAGRQKALEIMEIHQLIFTFLIKLGVSKEIAEVDCCKIEHVLSKESIEKIKEFINKE